MEAVTQRTGEEARTLLSTPDLIAVGVQGDEVRRRMHGTRATFVRVFEIHVDAPPAALPPGTSAGEFRIVGAPANIASAVNAVKAAMALANRSVPVTGFSLGDLRAVAPSAEEFRSLCRQLRDLGMVAIAETPLDLFLDDNGAEEFVRIAREEEVQVSRLTVHGQPPSGAEEAEARVTMVERAKRLQSALGGFVAFAPLPRTMSVSLPTTGYADVRQIALARVVVTNIPSIQVDWPLYGPKLAQVALTVGADDIDGVSAVDSGALGTRRSPLEEIKNNIRAAALDPMERDANFIPMV
jgi:CofH/MqnC C-terminal region